MSRLSTLVRATCHEYFGSVVVRAGRKQLVDNRCDRCPLRAPCVTWGGAPAHDEAALDAAAEVFNSAAAGLLGATP